MGRPASLGCDRQEIALIDIIPNRIQAELTVRASFPLNAVAPLYEG